MNKARTRNLKLYFFGLKIGRQGIIPQDMDAALADNLLTDIGCLERIWEW